MTLSVFAKQHLHMTTSFRTICPLLLVLILVIGGYLASRHSPQVRSTPITIGFQASPACTLIMVAAQKGFFAKYGVNVILQEFTAGKFALQALISGSLDVAISGELPVLLAAIQGNELHVITEIVERTRNEIRLIARRDGSESSAQHYFQTKKRRLSTSFGGGPEFFTYKFLDKIGIMKDNVILLSQRPEDMPAALASGSVDAIAIFDPYAFLAEQLLKEESITFRDSVFYEQHYLLSVSHDLALEGSQISESLLRALLDASAYIEQNPEEAKIILGNFTKLHANIIDAIWGNFLFHPVLSSTLKHTWEEELQWLRKEKSIEETNPFDLSSLIHEEAILKVASNHIAMP